MFITRKRDDLEEHFEWTVRVDPPSLFITHASDELFKFMFASTDHNQYTFEIHALIKRKRPMKNAAVKNAKLLAPIKDIIESIKAITPKTPAEVFPQVTEREHSFIELVIYREQEILKADDIVKWIVFEYNDIMKRRLTGEDDMDEVEWRKLRLVTFIECLEKRTHKYKDEGQYTETEYEPLHTIRQEMEAAYAGYLSSKNQQQDESETTK